MAVWWVWIDTTWVTNWLDPERWPVRAALFALMFMGLVMSAALPQAFGERGLAFAITLGTGVTARIGRRCARRLIVFSRRARSGAAQGLPDDAAEHGVQGLRQALGLAGVEQAAFTRPPQRVQLGLLLCQRGRQWRLGLVR